MCVCRGEETRRRRKKRKRKKGRGAGGGGDSREREKEGEREEENHRLSLLLSLFLPSPAIDRMSLIRLRSVLPPALLQTLRSQSIRAMGIGGSFYRLSKRKREKWSRVQAQRKRRRHERGLDLLCYSPCRALSTSSFFFSTTTKKQKKTENQALTSPTTTRRESPRPRPRPPRATSPLACPRRPTGPRSWPRTQ